MTAPTANHWPERGTIEQMVSKKEREVYDRVLLRDRVMVWESTGGQVGRQTLELWLSREPWICVAPLIDPSLWGTCSGEMTRDHVHTHTGGTKAKRAPTTMETVVILCSHHHLNGWATSHRPEIREYIKEANERYGQLAR